MKLASCQSFFLSRGKISLRKLCHEILSTLTLEDYLEKRYQVFVSSTYADLKDERQRVIQTLVVALLRDPDEIPMDKLENDLKAQEKLKHFRDRVTSERLIKHWKSAADLPGLVASSCPRNGWSRVRV